MGAEPLITPRGRLVGRYVMYDEFATGGMATVHFGRFRGEGGFTRTVAIKRLHPQYARDPDFVSMLVDEARIAARIKHPQVVAPLDVIAIDDRELLLVMEYVHGEVLSRLLGSCIRRGQPVPPSVVVSIMAGALYGLHAAHEAVSDQGLPLDIVHRDVSPPNILVGADGAARVLDFGVAKASMRASNTRERTTKGKLSYMSPEQLRCDPIDRRTDVFAAGVVLWEMLTLQRLFPGDDAAAVGLKIVRAVVPPPSRFHQEVPPALDAVVARALARHRDSRFATALDFARSLEQAVTPATPHHVSEWVGNMAGEGLPRRGQLLALIESAPFEDATPASVPSLLALSHPGPATLPVVPVDAPIPPPARSFPLPRLGDARSRRRALALASGAGLLVVALAGFAGRALHRPPSPERGPQARAATVSPLPEPSAEDVVVQDFPAPTSPAHGTGPAEQASSEQRLDRLRRRRPPRAKSRSQSGAARRMAAPDCEVHYLVDARGIRRIRPECLGR
jgi:eukaryotic-like serine/threonine-protein kinase